MRTVFCFVLKVQEMQRVLMPVGSLILGVHTRYNEPQLIVETDADRKEETETRTIFSTSSGNDIPDNPKRAPVYIGTYQMNGGVVVRHVFEIYEVKP